MFFFLNNLVYKLVNSRGNECRICHQRMERMHRTTMDKILGLVSGLRLRRHFCEKCGKSRLALLLRT
jgi:hypothetical protein